MVIFHDATNTIQNGGRSVLLKKEQKPVTLKKKFFKNKNKHVEKWVFPVMVESHRHSAKHQRSTVHEADSNQAFLKDAMYKILQTSYNLFQLIRTMIFNLLIWLFLTLYVNMPCIPHFSCKHKKLIGGYNKVKILSFQIKILIALATTFEPETLKCQSRAPKTHIISLVSLKTEVKK